MPERERKKGWMLRQIRQTKNNIRLWPEWMKREGKISKLPPMKKIVFGKGLLVPTLKGEKKITIRKFRKEAHDLIAGEPFIGSFQDGLDIILIATDDTKIKLFGEITDKEALEDGYKNARNLFFIFRKDFYTDLKEENIAAIIRYEILQIDKTPVVAANEFT